MNDSYSNIIIVDTLPPSFTSVSIASNSTINGAKYISSQVATVSYAAVDPSGVQYRTSLDNTVWTAWAPMISGESIDFGTTNGLKTIYVQYKDGVGNTTPTLTDSVIFDNGINAPVIVSPNSGNAFTTGDSYVSIVGTTDIDTNTMTINGLPFTYTKGSGMFSVRVSLSQGDNIFVFQATDNAGNVSTTASITITYDPALSSVNRGSDQPLQIGSVEAQTINLQRISTNPSIPSEVIQTDIGGLNNTVLPRITTSNQ